MMGWLPQVVRLRKIHPGVLALRASLIGFLLLPLAFKGYFLYLATEAALLGLAAVALSFLLGHGGIPSLGQAAFLGLGGYAVGLAIREGLPLGLGLLLAPVVAGAYGILSGLFVFRTQGIFVLMLTLAFGQMVYSAAYKWTSLTGGDDGLSLSQLSVNPVFLHVGAVSALAVAILILRHLLRTPYGKTFEAIRQSEEKARSLGIAAFWHKLLAYTVAAALTGLAGGGLALHRTFVSPHDLFWLTSAVLMVMVLLGGSQGLWGGAFGAILYTFIQAWVSSFTELWGLFVGLLLIFTVLFAREGLWPILERRLGGGNAGP
jgi:branched-chain amino acid transport system permease protein